MFSSPNSRPSRDLFRCETPAKAPLSTSCPATISNADNQTSFPSTPSSSIKSQKIDKWSTVDSGYASATTTPGDTPHTSNDQRTSTIFKLGNPRKLLYKKLPELQEFDHSIPEASLNRFQDLQELYGSELLDYVFKKGTKYTPISMKLKIMGDCEERASPLVMVTCDKSIYGKVKQFFNQDFVKKEFESEEDGVSSLRVLICNRPPRLDFAKATEVYWSNLPKSWESQIYGTAIRIGDASEGRVAKLGGIVKVTYESYSELYGMTVGHAFDQDLEPVGKDVPVLQNPLYDEKKIILPNPLYDEKKIILHDPFGNEEFELDLPVEDVEELSRSPPDTLEELKTNSSHFEKGKWSVFGQFEVGTCDSGHKSKKNSDWALINLNPDLRFDFHDPSASDLKALVGYDKVPTRWSELHSEAEVVLLDGQRTPRSAVLKNLHSMFLTPHSGSFSKVYDLHNLDISPGECGTWVVDSNTGHLYGHVVASDVLGEAYVMPASTTFSEMAASLNAVSVGPLSSSHRAQTSPQNVTDNYSDLLSSATTTLSTPTTVFEDLHPGSSMEPLLTLDASMMPKSRYLALLNKRKAPRKSSIQTVDRTSNISRSLSIQSLTDDEFSDIQLHFFSGSTTPPPPDSGYASAMSSTTTTPETRTPSTRTPSTRTPSTTPQIKRLFFEPSVAARKQVSSREMMADNHRDRKRRRLVNSHVP